MNKLQKVIMGLVAITFIFINFGPFRFMEKGINITYFPWSGNASRVMIDYSLCRTATEKVAFGLGSITFRFQEITDGKCRFQYGMEIENPMWEGDMTHNCSVPRLARKQVYKVYNSGVDITELQPYCSEIQND